MVQKAEQITLNLKYGRRQARSPRWIQHNQHQTVFETTEIRRHGSILRRVDAYIKPLSHEYVNTKSSRFKKGFPVSDERESKGEPVDKILREAWLPKSGVIILAVISRTDSLEKGSSCEGALEVRSERTELEMVVF